MKKWEYKVVYPKKVNEKKLNEYGVKGWELVNSETLQVGFRRGASTDSLVVWIFKRELK